jgi:response regulator RpfG family c-di-GMP phosphodiesterase
MARLTAKQALRKPSGRSGAAAAHTRLTTRQLRKAVEAAAAESGNATPTPANVAQALGRAFALDACVIYQRNNGRYTAVASWVPEVGLRETLTHAYLAGEFGPGEEDGFMPARRWAAECDLPEATRELLSTKHWVHVVRLLQGSWRLAAVWMLGKPKRPPSKLLVEQIRELTFEALFATLVESSLTEQSEARLLEDLGGHLTEQGPFEQRLEKVVERAQAATGVSSVQLMAKIPGDRTAIVNAAFAEGLGTVRESEDYARLSLQLAEEYFSRHPGPLMLPNPATLANLRKEHKDWMLDQGIRFLVLMPVMFGREFLGVLYVCSRFPEDETWQRARVFPALGAHVAAVLKSMALLAVVEEAHEHLRQAHDSTVRTLAQAAEARDEFTGGHLQRLEAYVDVLGRRLGLSDDEIVGLRLGAVVHDVGKLRVPDAVLLKPGPLSLEEREIIRQHAVVGEAILSRASLPDVAVQIARWHHERWDGCGYPDGLCGEAIPLAVRIVSVADAFDAICSQRPYKSAWPMERAVAEIVANAGSQFDPVVVEAFVELCEAGAIEQIMLSQTPSSTAREEAA